MTNFETIIKLASETAYEEDAYQIIGKIDGCWEYAHIEDEGRISNMEGETFKVGASGIED